MTDADWYILTGLAVVVGFLIWMRTDPKIRQEDGR
jgi:hypothetical protein